MLIERRKKIAMKGEKERKRKKFRSCSNDP
jgi:hypothetical protein